MARRYFGTDGIRGRANVPPLDASSVLRLAVAAADALSAEAGGRVLIGRDTRASCDMIEAALIAGLTSIGLRVDVLGVLPTPGVAAMVADLNAEFGIMISASHNGFRDNGLKLFGRDGFKLSDAEEAEIEARLDGPPARAPVPAEEIGAVVHRRDAPARYVEHALASLPEGLSLEGRRIVVDAAHGAAHEVAPMLLGELGADVTCLGTSPNGKNINDGVGSTHTEALRARVVETGADLGLALDGDADRLIVVDETGNELDGDQILGLIAGQWHAEGRLNQATVVSTVMSSLGFEWHLAEQGVSLLRTPVGDRHVVAEMRATGANLGGEPSGHIVMTDHATTGDGLVAALQVLAAARARGGPLSRAAHVFDPVPQRMVNLPFYGDDPLDSEAVQSTLVAVRHRLGDRGRLVVRQSGTEPLIRVMAEALTREEMDAALEDLATAIRSQTSLA